jgi:ribosomal protein L3 glutamine methyltransferase
LLARRLDTRKPLAYLTQEAWLHGIPFYVDERVIIPRSLIAEPLLDGSLDPWLSEHTQRVLDLCTGNGSVAVLAAMVYPEVVVDAADISADALAVARINTDKHHMSERVHLLHSDGLSALNGPYDLILCNPPYVNSQSMASLPTEYRQEPTISLAGGADGMDFIRPMLAALARVLSEHGVLVLEIGHERPHFESAFPHLNPVWLATSAGDDHVLLLTKDML